MEDGAFDLDADEVSAVREGEIEGGRVSPWLGDDEAEFGGAGHETQLRPLAPRLGVTDVHPWIFHWYECLERLQLDNKKRGLGGAALISLYSSILSTWTGQTGHFLDFIFGLDS